MGKAVITDNLGDGYYRIRIVWDRGGFDRRQQNRTAQIEALAVEIDRLEEERFAKAAARNMVCAPDGTSPACIEATAAARAAELSVQLARARFDALKRDRHFWAQAMPEEPVVPAWCADLTADMEVGTVVGTVETPGETVPAGYVQIRPGYEGAAAFSEARDYMITPAAAADPFGNFVNRCLMPGWQKWLPTFRHGTLTAIDSEAHTGDVSLDATNTSRPYGGHNVNAVASLSGVPIEYMGCHSAAFEVGDHVLVQFDGQQWNAPKIIGFHDHPKGCSFYVWFTLENKIGDEPEVTVRYYSVTDKAFSQAFFLDSEGVDGPRIPNLLGAAPLRPEHEKWGLHPELLRDLPLVEVTPAGAAEPVYAYHANYPRIPWEPWDRGLRGMHNWQIGTLWNSHYEIVPDPEAYANAKLPAHTYLENFWSSRRWYDSSIEKNRYNWFKHNMTPAWAAPLDEGDGKTWALTVDMFRFLNRHAENPFLIPYESWPDIYYTHLVEDYNFGKMPSVHLRLHWEASADDPPIKPLEKPWARFKFDVFRKTNNLQSFWKTVHYTKDNGTFPGVYYWDSNFYIRFRSVPMVDEWGYEYREEKYFYITHDRLWWVHGPYSEYYGSPQLQKCANWRDTHVLPGIPRWDEDGHLVFYDPAENWAELYPWEEKSIFWPEGNRWITKMVFPESLAPCRLISRAAPWWNRGNVSEPMQEFEGKIDSIFDLRNYFIWEIGTIEIICESPQHRPIVADLDLIDFSETPPMENLTPDEREMLDLHNEYRDGIGIQKLRWDYKLEEAAQRHANDLAANQMGGHTGSDGSSPEDRIRDTGYFHGGETLYGVFENVSVASPEFDNSAIFAAWLASPLHLENIERPYLQDFGYASATGDDGMVYRVVCFGTVA